MKLIICTAVLLTAFSTQAAEEKIRGILEKTAKPNACAQITDALNDVYYITKSDEAEKAVASFVGKNIKVVITGNVEAKEGDAANYFNLKAVEPYALKPVVSPEKSTSTPPAPPLKKDEQKPTDSTK